MYAYAYAYAYTYGYTYAYSSCYYSKSLIVVIIILVCVIMTSFQLPVVYNTSSKKLSNHVIADLELPLSCNAILQTTTPFGERTAPLWSTNYTSDTTFLKETQRLLSRDLPIIDDNHDISGVNTTWDCVHLHSKTGGKDTEDDLGFHAKYHYVEWEWLHSLNNNANFLQWMSMYNMASPVLSLCLPIFFLILPYFIIRLKGMPITLMNYYDVLRVVFQRHQIGQLFSVSSATWDKRIYILVSLVFYILQIYQNARTCVTFCKNMRHIHEQLFMVRKHIAASVGYMDSFQTCTNDLKSYDKFVANMKIHQRALSKMRNELERITVNSFSLSKIKQIGHVMKCFYQLYNHADVKTAMEYSFDFCGYIDNLSGLRKSITDGLLGKCKFSKKGTKFYNAFYPVTENTPIKNTYDINKHHLITGPNAAGKTTLLKATMFNIIMSQQIGFGCYDKATLFPFHQIHCYINIPDTSGRDSLFQAEARRCKDILTSINNSSKDTRHFCIFDELYSGTNPYEAIGSAAAYLTYLNKLPNVSFMLTTHFLGLCHRMKREKRIINCHMQVEEHDETFKYTYKLAKGISHVKGGVKVLKDLEYPDEIVEETNNVMSKIIL